MQNHNIFCFCFSLLDSTLFLPDRDDIQYLCSAEYLNCLRIHIKYDERLNYYRSHIQIMNYCDDVAEPGFSRMCVCVCVCWDGVGVLLKFEEPNTKSLALFTVRLVR